MPIPFGGKKMEVAPPTVEQLEVAWSPPEQQPEKLPGIAEEVAYAGTANFHATFNEERQAAVDAALPEAGPHVLPSEAEVAMLPPPPPLPEGAESLGRQMALQWALHLVFRPPARGAPSLFRGWRTPDPSPTRDGGAGLPGCKGADLCIEIEETDPTLPRIRASTPRGRSPRRARVPGIPSRTPSPDSRTPSPVLPTSGLQALQKGRVEAFVATAPEQVAAKDEEATPLSRVPAVVAGDASAIELVGGPASEDEEDAGAVPPPPPPVPLPLGPGTIGHPYTCAEACKYVTKAKGCKDGAACERCHLCEWHRNRRKCATKKRPAAPAGEHRASTRFQ